MMKRETTRGASRPWLPRGLAPLSALLVLVVLALNLSGVVMVRAAGYNWATFTDNAKLFTQTGKNDIATAAQQSGLRVYIVTTTQKFSSSGAWHSWVTDQARHEGDRGAVTIGFLDARGNSHNIYAVTGPNTGLTARQAGQGVDSARATFNSSGVTAGVIQTIHNYQSYGASSPGGSSAPASSGTGQGTGSAAPANSGSQGFGFGWLIPVIIVLAIVFVAFRLLRPRRPVVAPYNPNNPNLSGGPYGNPNNQVGPGYGNQVGPGGYVNQPGGYVGPNYGNNRGGGFGSGFGGGLAGGVVGGVVGSAIGNELFDHDRDGNGNDGNNAGGGNYGGDPNATNTGVTDTQNAQDAQGSWDTSGGGSWGGDSGGGGGDSGGSWGGDSGGGGGDGGGGDGGSW